MKMTSQARAVPDIDEFIFMLSDGSCSLVSIHQLMCSNSLMLCFRVKW